VSHMQMLIRSEPHPDKSVLISSSQEFWLKVFPIQVSHIQLLIRPESHPD